MLFISFLLFEIYHTAPDHESAHVTAALTMHPRVLFCVAISKRATRRKTSPHIWSRRGSYLRSAGRKHVWRESNVVWPFGESSTLINSRTKLLPEYIKCRNRTIFGISNNKYWIKVMQNFRARINSK